MEQLEVSDVQAANAETCFVGGENSEDEDCDSCDFILFGGATTISQLNIDAPPSGIDVDTDKFLSSNSFGARTIPESPPPDTYTVKDHLRVLCEELVLTGLPVRGPTAA